MLICICITSHSYFVKLGHMFVLVFGSTYLASCKHNELVPLHSNKIGTTSSYGSYVCYREIAGDLLIGSEVNSPNRIHIFSLSWVRRVKVKIWITFMFSFLGGSFVMQIITLLIRFKNLRLSTLHFPVNEIIWISIFPVSLPLSASYCEYNIPCIN